MRAVSYQDNFNIILDHTPNPATPIFFFFLYKCQGQQILILVWNILERETVTLDRQTLGRRECRFNSLPGVFEDIRACFGLSISIIYLSSIYLFTYLPIYLSIYDIYLSTYLSIYLANYLSITYYPSMSIHLSISVIYLSSMYICHLSSSIIYQSSYPLSPIYL